MDAFGQKKLYQQYPQLTQKKIETDPNEDPRGNFVLKNKVDLLNELNIVRQPVNHIYRTMDRRDQHAKSKASTLTNSPTRR